MKMFLITFLFGCFGAHRFIRGETGMGILYLLTFGLFGVGWIVDSVIAFLHIFKSPKTNCPDVVEHYSAQNYTRLATKKDMLELQQLILPGQNKLIMSLSDLERHSQSAISRYSDIVDDCNYLIGTTENPETFFTRYRFLLDTLHSLKDFEPFFYFEGYTPSQQLDYNISVKQVRIQELAGRLYNKALIKADSLKTERGKQNQFIKAYDSLMIYKNEMTMDTVTYIQEKFGTKIDIKSTDPFPDDLKPLSYYDFEHYKEIDIDQ